MTNILLVIVCLILGILLQRIKEFPENTPMALNNFVIYISLPALALIYIPQIDAEMSMLYPILTSWLVLLFACLIIPPIGRLLGWDRKTIGCILLTAGFGNTSFVGFPVIEALYGSEALKIALLVDQPGTFVAVTTAGIIIASIYSSGKTRKRIILRRVILFPPFLAFLVALMMNLADLQASGAALGVLESLGATITPLAITSVGMQLSVKLDRDKLQPLSLGLIYKLLLAPLILFILYVLMLGGSGPEVEVSIMEAAMAPMVTGSIIAMTYGLNPRLAAMMVGIGVPLSFLTLAGWYLLLTMIL